MEKRPTGKSILTLVGAIDTLHGQVADLSDDLKQEFHVRLASEIESIERKIDRLTQNGVDRSVIDFLSSQIVDLRHDLASRAEPQQIERLSDAVAHVAGQIGELRSEQVGQADFSALRAALEKVCGALAKSVAQQANDVPDQIRGLGDKLDALACGPNRSPPTLSPSPPVWPTWRHGLQRRTTGASKTARSFSRNSTACRRRSEARLRPPE